MPFWSETQNNSGGVFDEYPEIGIGHYLIVEADSPKEAESRIEEIIDYPNRGRDCPCCGDRWSMWFYGTGDEVPSVYGVPLGPLPEGVEPNAFVHYKDGRIAPHRYYYSWESLTPESE